MTEQQRAEITKQIQGIAETAFVGIDAGYRGAFVEASTLFHHVADAILALATDLNLEGHSGFERDDVRWGIRVIGEAAMNGAAASLSRCDVAETVAEFRRILDRVVGIAERLRVLDEIRDVDDRI